MSKTEYLHQLLRQAQPQVAYRYLLADSWYASAANRALVRQPGHHFVFALDSSPTVALSEAARADGQLQALHTLDFPVERPRRVYLRAVEQAVLVNREVFPDEDQSAGVLYLLSSDTDLNQATRRPIYPRRWKVEEY